jgi:hypothetical protein
MRETAMEGESNEIGREDNIDREVRKLIRQMEVDERLRRAVIETLVLLGSDVMLEHDL